MMAVIIAVAGTAREQHANRSYEMWTTPESANLRPIEHELHPLFVHDNFVGRRRVTGVARVGTDAEVFAAWAASVFPRGHLRDQAPGERIAFAKTADDQLKRRRVFFFERFCAGRLVWRAREQAQRIFSIRPQAL